MTDAQLIDALGGPAAVAKLLRLTPPFGIQRVHNWKKRGIPAKVRLDHQKVFARAEKAHRELHPDHKQEA